MKLSEEYILNCYKSGSFDRDTSFELLSELGYSKDLIETRLDLALDDSNNIEEVMDEFIKEEKENEYSFIHSSIVDENEIKYFLLKFSRKLSNNQTQ